MWFSGFIVLFVVTIIAPQLAVHWYQINFDCLFRYTSCSCDCSCKDPGSNLLQGCR
jgi:hypothetical protein